MDSATVVPRRYHEREYRTAVAIRPTLLAALPRCLRPVDHVDLEVRRAVELPFEPTTPTPETVPELVASCDIDHTVPPARTIRGGTAAAQARLAYFLGHGLPRYADERGDPNVDGTSMLSPYLHFGNISAAEVLLQARAAGPDARFAKFQDELLTWRELSFNFVYYNRRHRTVEAVPAWARDELRRGEADARAVLYTDDVMEQAQTGDELWNAAQRAYLVDGWMHNTLRMLWGKAIIQWTPNAVEALRVLEQLNNRYSLDGRDPNTYGGIHWILGKFDRPFYRRPIYGTVRYQSLKAAVKKFDVPRYIRRYSEPQPVLALSS